jgi:hypothetical protein
VPTGLRPKTAPSDGIAERPEYAGGVPPQPAERPHPPVGRPGPGLPGLARFRSQWVALLNRVPAAVYTLTAVAGAYAITGTAATLADPGAKTGLAQFPVPMPAPGRPGPGRPGLSRFFHETAPQPLQAIVTQQYSLVAAPGTYAITGAVASLPVARALTAGPGTYAITGAAASLLVGRTLTASAGGYTLTGSAATLAFTGAGAGATTGLAQFPVPMPAPGRPGPGRPGLSRFFPEAGPQPLQAIVTQQYVLVATPGIYAVTGAAAALPIARAFTAGSGSYAIAGVPAGLPVARRGTASAGTYAITGAAATLTQAGSHVFTASAGIYTVVGAAAGLLGPMAPPPVVVPGAGGGGSSGKVRSYGFTPPPPAPAWKTQYVPLKQTASPPKRKGAKAAKPEPQQYGWMAETGEFVVTGQDAAFSLSLGGLLEATNVCVRPVATRFSRRYEYRPAPPAIVESYGFTPACTRVEAIGVDVRFALEQQVTDEEVVIMYLASLDDTTA